MTREEARLRAADLVARMTAEEKAAQLLYGAAPVKRLGIEAHNWWNEALHGVARAGTATVFPQAIGMAASFDAALLREVAQAIGLEGRAKAEVARAVGDREIYKNLTYWSPNVNIFRDPRWGRGQETYGEDPFLTATMGVAFVRGLQGDGDRLLAAACAKHFAVHSGPEGERHAFNAVVGEQDLYETYLPAFEWLVKEAHVAGVMGAYNRVNGEPCCGSRRLLRDILRGDWGFDGYVVSDCGAIADFHQQHHVTENGVQSAALALHNGCDLNCGNIYGYLLQALEHGLIALEELDAAATRLLTVRVLLGEFEEPDPAYSVPYEWVDCPAHRELNRRMARESLVLLKNEGAFLPLDPAQVDSIAVIGPDAQSVAALEGNYCGTASEYVTVVDGVRRVFPQARVYYASGSHLFQDRVEGLAAAGDRLSEAAAVAKQADVTVLCVGLDPTIEGEEGSIDNGYTTGDKRDLRLPDSQRRLVETVCAASDKVVIVLLAGSALDLEDAGEGARAVVAAWYPGAQGGLAVAELLAGRFSPSGRLPVTFYHADQTLPPFEAYAMEGRTYRFLQDEPLYPFGYGLSYTTFAYDGLETDDYIPGEALRLRVRVRNTGATAGAEVVQAYLHCEEEGERTPHFQLAAVARVELAPGEARTVGCEIPAYWNRIVTSAGQRVPPRGRVTLYVGPHQPDAHSRTLCGTECLVRELQ